MFRRSLRSVASGETFPVSTGQVLIDKLLTTVIQLKDAAGTLLDLQTCVYLGSLDFSYMSGASHTLTPGGQGAQPGG